MGGAEGFAGAGLPADAPGADPPPGWVIEIAAARMTPAVYRRRPECSWECRATGDRSNITLFSCGPDPAVDEHLNGHGTRDELMDG